MPKDSRKKGKKARAKSAESEPAAGWTGDALADRVGRLRGTIEDLSSRLALAEERLRAAVESTEPAEGRMARFVTLASRAGARLEKELGDAVVALLEPTAAPGAGEPAAAPPAPRPRTAADGSAAPAPRRAPAATTRKAATTGTAATTRKATTRKATTRKAATTGTAATTRKATTRKATTGRATTTRTAGTARTPAATRKGPARGR